MRTTLTLTPEAEALLRRAMHERGVSFKDAVNDAIVAGLTAQRADQIVDSPTFDIGVSRIPSDRAIALAASLEDEELMRKRSVGK